MDEPVANITKRARNRQCFFRKQGPDYPVDDFPCFPEQQHSVCCRAGDACMSNGLCRAPGDPNLSSIRYTRGSCTDQTWQSSFCPQICEYTNPSGVAFISQCDKDSWYCCDSDFKRANEGKCCEWNPRYSAAVSKALPVTTMPSGGIPWEPKSTSSTSSTSVSSSTSTTSSGLTTISSLAGPGPSGGQELTPTTSLLAQPTAPSETPQAINNNTMPIALGAGIGGGIFAISCVLLGVWLVRRRRAAPPPPAPSDNFDGGDIYLSPQGWQSQQQQPFLVDHKPPAYQGGWQPQPFPVVQPAELGSGGQGRTY